MAALNAECISSSVKCHLSHDLLKILSLRCHFAHVVSLIFGDRTAIKCLGILCGMLLCELNVLLTLINYR